MHVAFREGKIESSEAPTITVTDWQFEQCFVLIDDVARCVGKAWHLAPRQNVTWPCLLGPIVRCSDQRLCKQRSANQCVSTLAIRPATSRRKRCMADAVRIRVLSDCGQSCCFRAFEDAAVAKSHDVPPDELVLRILPVPTSDFETTPSPTIRLNRCGCVLQGPVGHRGPAAQASACDHSVKLSLAQRVGVGRQQNHHTRSPAAQSRGLRNCLFVAHTVGQSPFQPRRGGVCIPEMPPAISKDSGHRRGLTATGLEGKDLTP